MAAMAGALGGATTPKEAHAARGHIAQNFGPKLPRQRLIAMLVPHETTQVRFFTVFRGQSGCLVFV